MNTSVVNMFEEMEVQELDTRNQYNLGCTIGGVECSDWITAAGGIVTVLNPLIGAILIGVGAIFDSAGC